MICVPAELAVGESPVAPCRGHVNCLFAYWIAAGTVLSRSENKQLISSLAMDQQQIYMPNGKIDWERRWCNCH